MTRSALRDVDVDYCLPLPEIAPLLVRLAGAEGEEGEFEVPEESGIEVDIAKSDKALEAGVLVADHLRQSEDGSAAEGFLKPAQAAQRRADIVRQAVLEEQPAPSEG